MKKFYWIKIFSFSIAFLLLVILLVKVSKQSSEIKDLNNQVTSLQEESISAGASQQAQIDKLTTSLSVSNGYIQNQIGNLSHQIPDQSSLQQQSQDQLQNQIKNQVNKQLKNNKAYQDCLNTFNDDPEYCNPSNYGL